VADELRHRPGYLQSSTIFVIAHQNRAQFWILEF